MMKTLFEYSALCVLVWCAVAESGDNDVSNLQHVVGEILRRLDEKDVQIEKLQQRLAEQETLNAAQEKLNSEQKKLNAEQTIRLADQDAIIETLKNRLVMFEYESASPAEAMTNATNSTSSMDGSSRFKPAEQNSKIFFNKNVNTVLLLHVEETG